MPLTRDEQPIDEGATNATVLEQSQEQLMRLRQELSREREKIKVMERQRVNPPPAVAFVPQGQVSRTKVVLQRDYPKFKGRENRIYIGTSAIAIPPQLSSDLQPITRK